jgi:hypothetical protein
MSKLSMATEGRSMSRNQRLNVMSGSPVDAPGCDAQREQPEQVQEDERCSIEEGTSAV